jgi:EAL domain-containing protein (putative c-di-GMP-specific phosphodiesterase class I)
MLTHDLLAPDNVPAVLAPYIDRRRVVDGRLRLLWRDLTLASAFQPIVSFSHSRIVGHEGLVRVVDAHGVAMPPPDLFAHAQAAGELPFVDDACRIMHMINARAASGWLFLNLQPELFTAITAPQAREFREGVQQLLGQAANRCILEVVEEAVTDVVQLEEGIQMLRALGLGVALDDFGAGHSNFDRVWRIRPDVVKLDRSFATHIVEDPMVRRLLPRLVSLLHEAGSLVLLEGIETQDQALIAMDADVDFGQGWFFARATPDPAADPGVLMPQINGLWNAHEKRSDVLIQRRREQLAPYLNAIGYCAVLLASGVPLGAAASSFLDLPHADCMYLLDVEGRQVGTNYSSDRAHGSAVLQALGHMHGARWSRRPYFRRALEHPGKPQVTRPYVSISSGRNCVTVSSYVHIAGADYVVCGDIDWQSAERQGHSLISEDW